MSLRVLHPGLHSLIVDFGRPGSRSLGVPVGGAADLFSLAIGNALVGNPPDAPALEICLSGPVLCADDDLACVRQIANQGIDRIADVFRLAHGMEVIQHQDEARRGLRQIVEQQPSQRARLWSTQSPTPEL